MGLVWFGLVGGGGWARLGSVWLAGFRVALGCAVFRSNVRGVGGLKGMVDWFAGRQHRKRGWVASPFFG